MSEPTVCLARNGPVICSLDVGHEGDHEAWGIGLVRVWPQAEDHHRTYRRSA